MKIEIEKADFDALWMYVRCVKELNTLPTCVCRADKRRLFAPENTCQRCRAEEFAAAQTIPVGGEA